MKLGPAFVVAFAAAALLATIPSATAQGTNGTEYPILDRYLAQYDREPGLPHCARVGGDHSPSDFPVSGGVNGTNAMLDMHSDWHDEHRAAVQDTNFANDANTYGIEFVQFHRGMVRDYDAWRLAHGFPATPPWDPATPIPAAFAYAPAPGCQPRNANIPAIPLPGWLTLEGAGAKDPVFGYAKLCDFPSLNRLGKAVDYDAQGTLATEASRAAGGAQSYHATVHNTVGGDMGRNFEVALRDPLFFGWHKYLDSRFALWETTCGANATAAPKAVGASSAARPSPGIDAGLATGVLALGAIAVGRRGAAE